MNKNMLLLAVVLIFSGLSGAEVLTKEQQEIVAQALSNYGVFISANDMRKFRCAASADRATGYDSESGLIFLPARMFSSSALPAQSLSQTIDLRAYAVLFELSLASVSPKYDSKRAVGLAEKTTIFRMKCPSCVERVSQRYQSLHMGAELSEKGHMIHDSVKVQRTIGFLGPQALPCKACAELK